MRVSTSLSPCLFAFVVLILVGVTACGGGSSSEADCSTNIDVVLWGGTQWQELAEAVAKDGSSCAEYYISIPPQDSDKTKLRGPDEFKRLRALSEDIHPVAEIRFTSEAGWRAWALARGGDFYEAGIEARRRMAQRGLDVDAGETWALNELSEEVLEDAPGWRADVREFLRGLYDGETDMSKARGIVFNIGPFSDERDLGAYKASLQGWLTDEPFWSDLDTYVDFFAHEAFLSPFTWGEAGASPAARAEALNDYIFHVTNLADAGPDTVETARKFLQRTYVPLMNAAWPHEGLGRTNLVSAETMSHFVSAEVEAVRQYGVAHAQTAPQGGFGFAWAPNPAEPSYTEQGRDTVVTRLAHAIHDAYENGVGTDGSACGPPDENMWCTGDVEGASLNDAWKMFSSWD
jgi:hypothetical protein